MLCNARLVDLELTSNGEVVAKANAKKPSLHYPYCSRCWRSETEEGRLWNNAKTDKSYRKTHSRLKYRRSQVEALVIAKGFRLKKTRSRIWELVKVETGEVKSFELLELVVKYLEQVNVKQ